MRAGRSSPRMPPGRGATVASHEHRVALARNGQRPAPFITRTAEITGSRGEGWGRGPEFPHPQPHPGGEPGYAEGSATGEMGVRGAPFQVVRLRIAPNVTPFPRE